LINLLQYIYLYIPYLKINFSNYFFW